MPDWRGSIIRDSVLAVNASTLTKVFTLSSSQLLNLVTAPIRILDAPLDPTLAWVIKTIQMQVHFKTTPYSTVGVGDFIFGDFSQQGEIVSFGPAGSVDSTVTSFYYVQVGYVNKLYLGVPVDMYELAPGISGGDGHVHFYIEYSLFEGYFAHPPV